MVSTDPSAFNSSLLACLPQRYRSPTTTASTLRHYSPLQQNDERAVDPSHQLQLQHQERGISISPFNMSQSNSSSELPVAGNNQNSDISSDNKENRERVEGDDEEERRLLSLSVKTLTSLASYTNKHQKAAQKILERARMSTKAAAEASRAISPNPCGQDLDGASAHFSSYGLGREGSEHFSRVPRNTHINSSARSSVLSNGPGAPQPLTAGPPGQRQYKASTLEGPLRALNAQKPPPSSFDESHLNNTPVALPKMHSQHSVKKVDLPNFMEQQTKELRKTGGSQTLQTSGHNPKATTNEHPWGRNPSFPPTPWVSESTETRTLEQIQEYYPKGFTPYYNSNKFVHVPDHDTSLPPLMGPSARCLYPDLEARSQSNARHRAAFYWRKEEHLKAFDQVTREFAQKLQNQHMGISDSAEILAAHQAELDPIFSSSDVGKALNISVTFVDQMQTHEVAKPLLNMAFTTLSTYWDNGRLLSVPTGFEKANRAEIGNNAVKGGKMGQSDYASKWDLPQSPTCR